MILFLNPLTYPFLFSLCCPLVLFLASYFFFYNFLFNLFSHPFASIPYVFPLFSPFLSLPSLLLPIFELSLGSSRTPSPPYSVSFSCSISVLPSIHLMLPPFLPPVPALLLRSFPVSFPYLPCFLLHPTPTPFPCVPIFPLFPSSGLFSLLPLACGGQLLIYIKPELRAAFTACVESIWTCMEELWFSINFINFLPLSDSFFLHSPFENFHFDCYFWFRFSLNHFNHHGVK